MAELSHIRSYRLLEMIPGVMVWSTFIIATITSFIRPMWVIYFIIVFSLLWLFRVGYFVLYILISWKRLRRSLATNWYNKLDECPNWKGITHIVFLPTYKEPLEVIEHTFESLAASYYPKDQIVVVLAGEERDKEQFTKYSQTIANRWEKTFKKIIVTIHPDNLPGEIKAKGANVHWAGGRVKEWVDTEGLNYDCVIVSYFDIDTCVHKQYFAALTHAYITHPNPTRSSFQPVAVYNNNIWDAPALTRVSAFSTTFWLMTDLARPERLFTFSSHAMSFRALVDVGFWQKDIVTDDSRIFLQCLLRYNGDYTVTPLYITVSMDTVSSESWLKTMLSLYKQQRRWGWGIEHFPYMVWHFWHNNRIPFRRKMYYLWNLGEGMYSWATAPIMLFVFGRLPLWLIRNTQQSTVLAQNAPFVLQWLMLLSMAGMIVSAGLSTVLLPTRPASKNRIQSLAMIAQWLLLPITLIVFGSIPATEAQTRLMLGTYLGFHVTEKTRQKITY